MSIKMSIHFLFIIPFLFLGSCSGSGDGSHSGQTLYNPSQTSTEIINGTINLFTSQLLAPTSVPTNVTATFNYPQNLFNYPQNLVTDNSGNIFVVDNIGSSIRKITPNGKVITFAGRPGAPGSANGIGIAASFNGPRGITIDSSGNLYIADLYNHIIRKITSAGVVTTFAGILGIANSNDAAGTFTSPLDLTFDAAGNLYVLEPSAIRKIAPGGAVTTIAGIPWVYRFKRWYRCGSIFSKSYWHDY